MSKEEEELREKIVKSLDKTTASRFWSDREAWIEIATDQILERVKSKCYLKAERELPNPTIDIHIWRDYSPSMAYDTAIQDILTPDSEGRVFRAVYEEW